MKAKKDVLLGVAIIRNSLSLIDATKIRNILRRTLDKYIHGKQPENLNHFKLNYFTGIS